MRPRGSGTVPAVCARGRPHGRLPARAAGSLHVPLPTRPLGPPHSKADSVLFDIDFWPDTGAARPAAVRMRTHPLTLGRIPGDRGETGCYVCARNKYDPGRRCRRTRDDARTRAPLRRDDPDDRRCHRRTDPRG
ncbi:hypothetical protein ARTHRO9V_640003 [Arthrobacter sp. 9V]|nr:hypothetical protein ARTHRO9V_640003 [Arthrobacter sp. 9V]